MAFDKDIIKNLMDEGPVVKTDKKSNGKEGIMFLESLTQALESDGQVITPEVEKLYRVTKRTEQLTGGPAPSPRYNSQPQQARFQESPERELPAFSLSDYKRKTQSLQESVSQSGGVDPNELRGLIKEMVAEEMESLIEKVITDKMLRLYSEEFVMNTVRAKLKKKQ